MQQVTVHVAKTNLSKLIEAALLGEEIIIAKGNKPVVRLVAISQNRFQFGLLRDRLVDPGPDFFQPLDEEELKLWEGVV